MQGNKNTSNEKGTPQLTCIASFGGGLDWS